MPKTIMTSQNKFLPSLLGISLSVFPILSNQPSFAEAVKKPEPSDAPLEMKLLEKPNDYVVTANTIHQDNLAVPSLWWVKENTENKLLDNWIAHPKTANQAARVDLIVNQQLWSLLDYLERYEFINRVGTFARSYGYNIRIFNQNEKQHLASYTCNFQETDTNSKIVPTLCSIQMENKGKRGVRRSPLQAKY
jgi:hypothetical protein